MADQPEVLGLSQTVPAQPAAHVSPLAGALADLNVTLMFVLAGDLLTLIALAALANPRLRVPEPAS